MAAVSASAMNILLRFMGELLGTSLMSEKAREFLVRTV
jgi:hypothetical protein